MGRVFGICVERGSELPAGSPGRKFKGRVVFQGNSVRDEENYNALFSDLGSSPANVSSDRFLDCYGLLAGHAIQMADAVRAYTQAALTGAATAFRATSGRRRGRARGARSAPSAWPCMVTPTPARAGSVGATRL